MVNAASESTPPLSVIIPLYNKRRTVLRAIDSILAQAVAAEIIVVDDGSTDGSAELVADRYRDRLTLVKQSNSGPGAARNRGVALSSSELVGFLDADDEWEQGFAEAALVALSRNPQVAAYVCGYDAGAFADVRPNKVALLGYDGPNTLPSSDDGEYLKLHVDAMHSSCVVVRKSTFKCLGGFFTDNSCRYGEDSYLWLGLILREVVYWDPRPMVRFHVEDSALGFAQQVRTKPRPISVNGERLAAGLSPPMQHALKAIMRTYARHDFEMMWRSGAFGPAVCLGRRFGFVSPFSAFINPLRYIRRRFFKR